MRPAGYYLTCNITNLQNNTAETPRKSDTVGLNIAPDYLTKMRTVTFWSSLGYNFIFSCMPKVRRAKISSLLLLGALSKADSMKKEILLVLQVTWSALSVITSALLNVTWAYSTVNCSWLDAIEYHVGELRALSVAYTYVKIMLHFLTSSVRT